MKRIGIVNNPLFPVDEWTRQTIQIDTLFNEPVGLTVEEIKLARKIMTELRLEIDNEEGLIEFIIRPQDFMNLLIQLKRL